MLLAQGLERSVPELLGVAAMALDVIADEALPELALLPTHTAIGFPLQLERPDGSPPRGVIPRAPALGLI
ncbi:MULTISPECIES: hypothetical protein [Rhizobium/Agrobacterium group]|uniref:Uncharacterized protein n=1 Tax=Agrobacterium vitis TaxID=373 RepID=A0ABD6HCD3_AGRVI|nr:MULTISPECIES: hypothetical protein [Rhizobium/Agrobacterium group]MUO27708.1 hypothetical protein [Agrobacterium vitis]MUO44233.1 hypothetical protein [Agrobacterium vitis]MUP12319.1 hypothetical protein [Agrobacterium vitis]